MKALLLALLLASSHALWAIPEESYERVWNAQVLTHFQDLAVGEFKNAQGMPIRYRSQVHPDALRTLVILPGRSEPMLKYAELMFDLQSPQLNIFIMDHQGQGESPRLVRSDAGHVRRFSDYVRDLRQFMRDVVIPQSAGTERVLLAHSMGGAIAIHYMRQVPTAFTRAVLSAPMLKLNTAPYSETVALWYARALFLAGKGAAYAPGRGPYRPDEDMFESNDVTHSRVRFESAKSVFTNSPELIVGGPTVRWVKEAITASKKTTGLARHITAPILIFQAGKDEIVENSRQASFCAKAPSCQITLLPGAKHEVLAESDPIRNKVLERLKSFLEL